MDSVTGKVRKMLSNKGNKKENRVNRKEQIKKFMLKHPGMSLLGIAKELRINVNHVERWYMVIKREICRERDYENSISNSS